MKSVNSHQSTFSDFIISYCGANKLNFLTMIDLKEAKANLYPFVAFIYPESVFLKGLEIKYK
jgi:hypothetical protein